MPNLLRVVLGEEEDSQIVAEEKWGPSGGLLGSIFHSDHSPGHTTGQLPCLCLLVGGPWYL